MAEQTKVGEQEYHQLAIRIREHGEEGSGVTDTLANLRHICDEYGWDFGELDKQAYQQYLGGLEVRRTKTA